MSLPVSGPLLDPAGFSSRERPTRRSSSYARRWPAVRLAELLDLTTADSFDGGVHDDLGHSLDGLAVIDAPPGADVPGRFIGVYHSLVGGVFVSHVATSDDLRHGTPGKRRPARLAAVDRQRPGRRLRARRRARHARPVVGRHVEHRRPPLRDVGRARRRLVSAEANLPRSLAATAEGTPELRVLSWNGTPGARRSRSRCTTSRTSRPTGRRPAS